MTKVLWILAPLTFFGVFLTVDSLLLNGQYSQTIWDLLHPAFSNDFPATPVLHKNFSQVLSL